MNGVKKVCVLYLHTMEHYSAKETNEISPFQATWLELSKSTVQMNKSVKESQILYDTTYMWNLKHNKKQ